MTTHVIAPIDLPAFLAPAIAAALERSRQPGRDSAVWRPCNTPTAQRSSSRQPVGSGSVWSQACHFSDVQSVRRYDERSGK